MEKCRWFPAILRSWLTQNDIYAVYFGYVVPFIVKYGSNFDPPFLHVRLDTWEIALIVVSSRYFDVCAWKLNLIEIAW